VGYAVNLHDPAPFFYPWLCRNCAKEIGMLQELRLKPASAALVVAVNTLIRNQNALIAKLRGNVTQKEADAIAEMFKDQG